MPEPGRGSVGRAASAVPGVNDSGLVFPVRCVQRESKPASHRVPRRRVDYDAGCQIPKTSGFLIVGDPDLFTMCHGASSNKLLHRESGSQFRRKASATRSGVGTPSTSSATIAIGIQSATKHTLRQAVAQLVHPRPRRLGCAPRPSVSGQLDDRSECQRRAVHRCRRRSTDPLPERFTIAGDVLDGRCHNVRIRWSSCPEL